MATLESRQIATVRSVAVALAADTKLAAAMPQPKHQGRKSIQPATNICSGCNGSGHASARVRMDADCSVSAATRLPWPLANSSADAQAESAGSHKVASSSAILARKTCWPGTGREAWNRLARRRSNIELKAMAGAAQQTHGKSPGHLIARMGQAMTSSATNASMPCSLGSRLMIWRINGTPRL